MEILTPTKSNHSSEATQSLERSRNFTIPAEYAFHLDFSEVSPMVDFMMLIMSERGGDRGGGSP